MKLLNEMAHNMVIEQLLGEFTKVLEYYDELVMRTVIREGVLDNLSDDMIRHVAKLEKRITTIKEAKDYVAKMKAGTEKDEKLTEHRQLVSENRKELSATLEITMEQMKKFEELAEAELSGSPSESITENEETPSTSEKQAKQSNPVNDMIALDD